MLEKMIAELDDSNLISVIVDDESGNNIFEGMFHRCVDAEWYFDLDLNIFFIDLNNFGIVWQLPLTDNVTYDESISCYQYKVGGNTYTLFP